MLRTTGAPICACSGSAMRMVNIVTGDRARAILAGSLAQTARAVALSLGPAGCAVMRDRGANSVEAMHSGSAIARVVAEGTGPWSIAPRILDGILSDIEREYQDGTARAACICEAIFAIGVAASAHGISPGALADELLNMLPALDGMVERETVASPSPSAIAQAACHDADIAGKLASLDAATNPAGLVDVRESPRPGVTASSNAGFVIDVQPYAIGFTPGEQVPITMERASLLVVNDIIDEFGPFVRVLEQFVEKNRSLVIVARGFGDE